MLLVARANFVRHDCDMCGRFTRMYTWREVVALHRLTDPSPPSNLQPRYNICPTTQIDAVIERGSKRVLKQMRWGLVPSWWNKPLSPDLDTTQRRSMKRAKVGFFSTPSCTPDVTVLAAKANTLPTRSGWRMARSRPSHHYIPVFYLSQWAGDDGRLCERRANFFGQCNVRRPP
jgi:putative SOS response-associated peptidase YedK